MYIVQRGDTLSSIAQRFDTTVNAIVAANQIVDPSLIVVGQKLIIPTTGAEPPSPPEPKPYTRLHPVRRGEILPGLAFRYGTTVRALQKANGLNRFGLLWPGQQLIIPQPTAATASTPGFPIISAHPTPVLQGKTMSIRVKGDRALKLRGQFLDQELLFVAGENWQWALVGVGATARPGAYPLLVEATEAEGGDLLSMQETITVTAGTFPKINVSVATDRQELLDPVTGSAELERLDQVWGQASPRRLWDGPFRQPLEGQVYISAPFGQRRSYAGGPVNSYHSGLDYSASAGTPVLAPITGTVVLAEPLKVRGKAVVLDHGLGVYTGFWHLSKIGVQVGQRVGPGDVVGHVGNTGLSTGPHLHWEMRVHGVPVDPLQWTRRSFP